MKATQVETQRLVPVTRVEEELHLLERFIKERAVEGRTLQILEAGCGQKWMLDLADASYVLTGVDLDQAALETRRTVQRDLHQAILGDLRTVQLPENTYDVVYNSFVLEHIRGAEQVLESLVRWLKPGGLLILRVPDPQAVYGAMTRITPFWLHVWFKRFVAGCKDAGTQGAGPFPTVYDKVVSRRGLRRWCDERGLAVRAECCWTYPIAKPGIRSFLVGMLVKTIHLGSLGRLADDHVNLTFVIEKTPRSSPVAACEDLQSQGTSR